ncbi:LapA family protein [bacterium]|nr:MAG: LapA family protein [bacterium]
MASFVRKLIGALVLCLAVLLALENAEELKHSVRFTSDFFIPGWKFETPPIPLFFVILVAFVLGLLYSWLNGLIAIVAAKSESFFLQKKIKTLEKELVDERSSSARVAEEPAPETANSKSEVSSGEPPPGVEPSP